MGCSRSVVRSFEGEASYYAASLDGNLTANGEVYDHDGLSAAHRDLPFGTWVRVTNKKNGRQVTVIINDRGPFIKNRIIDLSGGAAEALDMIQIGVVQVRVDILE